MDPEELEAKIALSKKAVPENKYMVVKRNKAVKLTDSKALTSATCVEELKRSKSVAEGGNADHKPPLPTAGAGLEPNKALELITRVTFDAAMNTLYGGEEQARKAIDKKVKNSLKKKRRDVKLGILKKKKAFIFSHIY